MTLQDVIGTALSGAPRPSNSLMRSRQRRRRSRLDNGVHSATLKHGRVPARHRVFHQGRWHSVASAPRQHGTLHIFDEQSRATSRDQGLQSAAQFAETCGSEVHTMAHVPLFAGEPCFHLQKGVLLRPARSTMKAQALRCVASCFAISRLPPRLVT